MMSQIHKQLSLINLSYLLPMSFVLCVCFTATSYAASESSANGKIVSNVHGPLGESYMDHYFEMQGWEKLEGEVGRNGIDGLYVRRGKNGEIIRVMVSESKFGGSNLNVACSAQQMSHAWTLCKLDALDKSLESKMALLEKKEKAGSINSGERQELENLRKEMEDMKQVRRHVEKENFRRRIFRSRIKGGVLEINISDVEEVDGKVKEKTPDRRANVESGEASQQVKRTRKISLKEPPKSGDALKVYDAYFDQIEEGLQKSGMSKSEAKKAVVDLKEAYKQGHVIQNTGPKGQAKFLRDRLIASIEKQIKNESKFSRKVLLTRKLALLKASERMKSMLHADWFMHGLEQFKKKNIHPLFGSRPVKYVKGILTRGGKILAKIPPGITGGLGAGLVTFVFDAGGATYSFITSQTFRPEFERKLADATVTGGVIGSGTGVAIMLGATPVGWVVVGIGVAGYFITDMAVQTWHKTQDRKYLTRSDLMMFGIEAKDTIPLNVGHWNKHAPLQLGNWK